MLHENSTNATNKNEDNGAVQNELQNEHIFLKAAARLLKIYPEDILWIEALGDYVTIHTKNERYTVHSTMKGIESKLPSNDFVRVHRSYIIRIDRIAAIEGKILVIEKKLIPVSKSYRKSLMERLNLL